MSSFIGISLREYEKIFSKAMEKIPTLETERQIPIMIFRNLMTEDEIFFDEKSDQLLTTIKNTDYEATLEDLLKDTGRTILRLFADPIKYFFKEERSSISYPQSFFNIFVCDTMGKEKIPELRFGFNKIIQMPKTEYIWLFDKFIPSILPIIEEFCDNPSKKWRP